ncbi:secreted RxLR effector protein 161-like [Macadamia integrifolia]|uniref:secreted RxLR effector protein 161-like n=1 Tax=Macadamia integrifolia TaxID=60698 RepID=UPI001C529EAE|nr:secreted RxLR effector protein 161-like [Macadamia integrifolia]
MENSKKGNVPFQHGVHLSKSQCPSTPEDIEEMKRIPYASTIGSLMYDMLCTSPDICYAVGMVSCYQSNPRKLHWNAMKGILKYLRRTKDYFLVYRCDQLSVVGYIDSDFQTDKDDRKSTPGWRPVRLLIKVVLSHLEISQLSHHLTLKERQRTGAIESFT